MQISTLKSQKANSGLSNLLASDWEKKEELERVPCIWYPVPFKNQTKTLLSSGSEANAMS